MLRRAIYRGRQFFGSFGATITADERTVVATVLGDGLLMLFESMSPRDQRHCLDVYNALLRQNCLEPEVLTAALLHDAGKGGLSGAKVRLWHRVAYVALAAGPRVFFERLARRGGLRAIRGHAERGAILAAAFGASESVVELIRHHEDGHQRDERLRRLKAADDSC